MFFFSSSSSLSRNFFSKCSFFFWKKNEIFFLKKICISTEGREGIVSVLLVFFLNPVLHLLFFVQKSCSAFSSLQKKTWRRWSNNNNKSDKLKLANSNRHRRRLHRPKPGGRLLRCWPPVARRARSTCSLPSTARRGRRRSSVSTTRACTGAIFYSIFLARRKKNRPSPRLPLFFVFLLIRFIPQKQNETKRNNDKKTVGGTTTQSARTTTRQTSTSPTRCCTTRRSSPGPRRRQSASRASRRKRRERERERGGGRGRGTLEVQQQQQQEVVPMLPKQVPLRAVSSGKAEVGEREKKKRKLKQQPKE